MIDERAFLAQLEAANADELSQILRRPSVEEQRLLEIYFGAERLQRLRSLALATQRRAVARGHVVVLHGIMGGEMTVLPVNAPSQFIWMHIPRLIRGAAGWLRMTPDFSSQFDVRPTGIIKKYYAEQLLGLAGDGWNVKPFWYDWRQDLARIADVLRKFIDTNFPQDAAVHLVAHSMGGLVSRTYIQRHSDRWRKGGRLVMLGTPNHGSFAIPQVITGAYDTVRKLALIDLTHSRRELCDILNSFPGSLQMLPSALEMPSMKRMYDASLWSAWGVPQKILDLARTSHERLTKVVDGARMSYIAGFNQSTKVDVTDWSRLDHSDAYRDSLEGDGTVPHALSFLRDGNTRIPTYFVNCSHGALPNHTAVIQATKQILATGKCALPTTIPKIRSAAEVETKAAVKEAEEVAEEEYLRTLSRKVNARSRVAGATDEPPLSTDEMQANAILVRSFLADASNVVPSETTVIPAIGTSPSSPPSQGSPAPPVSIGIQLVRAGIQELNAATRKADAIAVGHYIGVAPQNAELAIDKAISGAPSLRANRSGATGLVITDLCRRGAIIGELGQNFLLPDPRDPQRTIVIAGMGRAGTFREGELAVLTRELAWTLGRSGRKHLCTVLIGSGAGNLDTADAVQGWLRGVRRAVHDAAAAAQPQLQSITFIEYSEAVFVHLHTALVAAIPLFANDPQAPLQITYTGPTASELRQAKRAAIIAAGKRGKREARKALAESRASGDPTDPEPMRLTVQLQGQTFQFAALTEEASIPQRETIVDPALIREANSAIPVASSFSKQFDQGHLLGRLLLPRDMRELIVNQRAPVVLALDALTARIHWESVAVEAAETRTAFDGDLFLGTLFGLTRQLRTTFAQLPEPPMLSGRPLRVLVVADPADDQPLPGAQEEGEAVAAIFEEFGRAPNREVEVVRLFGPAQATRVAVLDQLINHRFDVLHFAGHCFFNEETPAASGWLFTGGTILSAHELNRVDRIPRFVFSNACESGITPDQVNERIAPSFAEAFFARGVANFICTAWEVDDRAALEFSRRFYRGILGLRGPAMDAEPLHAAMREARREIALLDDGGMRTWGAYQHYGDPNLRFVPRTAPSGSSTVAGARRKPAKKTAAPRPRRRRRRVTKKGSS